MKRLLRQLAAHFLMWRSDAIDQKLSALLRCCTQHEHVLSFVYPMQSMQSVEDVRAWLRMWYSTCARVEPDTATGKIRGTLRLVYCPLE